MYAKQDKVSVSASIVTITGVVFLSLAQDKFWRKSSMICGCTSGISLVVALYQELHFLHGLVQFPQGKYWQVE